MDLNYKQELTVGGLVLLAIALFIVGTTWLGGRSITGDLGEYWQLQFRDVGGLKVSSAVRVSGVPVGLVEDIRLVEAGKVLVAVSFDEGIVPKADARAEVVSIGFVGDAAIDFYPGDAAEPLPHDQVVVGTQAGGLTSLAEQLGGRADSVMVGLQAILNQRTADDMHATMVAMQNTLEAMQRMVAVYADREQGPTAALTETLTAMGALMARLDSTLANPSLASAIHRTDTLTANLATATARFDSTVAAINRGEGTLGKLVTDSGLYRDLRDVTQAATDLVNELKRHPGQISPSIKVCVIPGTC